jgi:hypothetical protein
LGKHQVPLMFTLLLNGVEVKSVAPAESSSEKEISSGKIPGFTLYVTVVHWDNALHPKMQMKMKDHKIFFIRLGLFNKNQNKLRKRFNYYVKNGRGFGRILTEGHWVQNPTDNSTQFFFRNKDCNAKENFEKIKQ